MVRSSLPEPEAIWQSVPHVSIDNRGLNYGDGLFETMLVRSGRLPFERLHLERLRHGCERLSLVLDQPELEAMLANLRAAASGLSWSVAKLLITRKPGGRGYGFADRQTELAASLHPANPWDTSPPVIRSAVASLRLSNQPKLAGVKHLNRLEQVLARAEFDTQTFPELIVLDADGRVVEGVASNLFIVSGGLLVTPSLNRCGVEGVARAQVLQSMEVQVRDIELEEVLQADEVFFTNNVQGVRCVEQIVTAGRTVVFTRRESARRVHAELSAVAC